MVFGGTEIYEFIISSANVLIAVSNHHEPP
jgi:hypothetical protein